MRALGVQRCNRISHLDTQIITDMHTDRQTNTYKPSFPRIRRLWIYDLLVLSPVPIVLKLSGSFGGHYQSTNLSSLFCSIYLICPRKCHLIFVHYSIGRSFISILIDWILFFYYSGILIRLILVERKKFIQLFDDSMSSFSIEERIKFSRDHASQRPLKLCKNSFAYF